MGNDHWIGFGFPPQQIKIAAAAALQIIEGVAGDGEGPVMPVVDIGRYLTATGDF